MQNTSQHTLFSVLHGMQMQSSDENSVCPAVHQTCTIMVIVNKAFYCHCVFNIVNNLRLVWVWVFSCIYSVDHLYRCEYDRLQQYDSI